MTKRWWPLGTLDKEDGCRLFANSVSIWERKWLPTSSLQVTGGSVVDKGAQPAPISGAHLWSYAEEGSDCAVMWIMALPSITTFLLGQALDLQGSSISTATLQKSPLLASLEKTLVIELLTGLSGAMGVLTEKTVHRDVLSAKFRSPQEPHSPITLPQGGMSFDISTASGQCLMTIVCAAPLLRKNRFLAHQGLSKDVAINAERDTALAQRAAALADVRVAISVSLGQVQLTIPQLTTLAVGDVITLSKPLEGASSAMPVVISDTQQSIGEGVLGRSGGKFSLQLTAMAS